MAVKQNRTDQFHTAAAIGRYGPPPLLALAGDAGISHEFPDAPVRRCNTVRVVVVIGFAASAVQVLCGNLGCAAAGYACKLNLNAEWVGEQC